MIRLLTLTILIILPGVTPEKPDTNFKSIHQVQSEKHAADTLRPDTVKKIEPARVELIPAVVPKTKALSYASLFVVVILLLTILILILILIRSRRKIKRE
jgi:hypothetical protein